jgi:hypothetical protein
MHSLGRESARSTIELQRSKLLKLNFAWREKFPFDAGSTAGKFPYRVCKNALAFYAEIMTW